MRTRPRLLILLVAALAVPCIAARQAVGQANGTAFKGPLPWKDVEPAERRMLTHLLDSPHWTFRAFALLRSERYSGAEIEPLVHARLTDDSWQLRCFALRTARRLGLSLPADAFANESDARVIRTALRCGVKLEPEKLQDGARRLLRSRDPEEMLLGLEIAAASEAEALRREASRRIDRIIRDLDDLAVLRVGERLARVVGLTGPPKTAAEWRGWLADRNRKDLLAAPPSSVGTGQRAVDPPIVARLDAEAFSRLIDYLDGLRNRDLDLAIVMDATQSMVPMYNQTKAGIESLIRFLDDISRTMRLAFVAYRDYDNRPVAEGHSFTSDTASIKKFLGKVRITGGADLPEAVLEGLAACGGLDWNEDATRQIVVVGDARPHQRDMYGIAAVLESFREKGIVVDVAHVWMQPNEDYISMMTPDRYQSYLDEIVSHNADTAEAFTEVARLGGGQKVRLDEADRLVPAIMHLTIAETWWPAFDEFYALYLELCR